MKLNEVFIVMFATAALGCGPSPAEIHARKLIIERQHYENEASQAQQLLLKERREAKARENHAYGLGYDAGKKDGEALVSCKKVVWHHPEIP